MAKWPDDFTKAIIVTIEKKMNASACADHRTINLITHSSKIMLRLLEENREQSLILHRENTVWIKKREWNVEQEKQ